MKVGGWIGRSILIAALAVLCFGRGVYFSMRMMIEMYDSTRCGWYRARLRLTVHIILYVVYSPRLLRFALCGRLWNSISRRGVYRCC